MNELKRYNFLVSEINGLFHEIAQSMGLADSTLRILYAVCNEGDSCLLSHIIRMTGTSKQTINSALRKLEGEGMVYLETEGRQKRVCLTESGRSLAQRTAARVIAAENAVFAAWTEGEREAYIGLTQRYLDQLREQMEEMN